MFPSAVSYFYPAMEMIIFLHGVEMVRIIRKKENESWLIIWVVQFTNRVFRVNRNSICNQIRVITGSFILAGSIVKGTGGWIQFWSTTTIWKCIIESVINCHVFILSHWNFIVHTYLLNVMTE